MTQRRAVLFFIPGNPGISAFYETFFDTLTVQVPGLEIITTDHLGFEEDHNVRDPVHRIDLDAQIEHKIDLLDGILLGRTAAEKAAKIPIFIAGHSVGAYMALRVLERRSNDISRVYLLTPTINDISKSQQGRILTPLYAIPSFVSIIAAVVFLLTTFIPGRLLQWLVQRVTKLPDDACHIVRTRVLRPSVVYTALTLAQSEMRQISAPDEKFWAKFGSRCSSYWATDDHWVSESHRETLLNVAPGLESFNCLESPHAFCIRHGDLVARKVGQWMQRDIKRHRPSL